MAGADSLTGHSPHQTEPKRNLRVSLPFRSATAPANDDLDVTGRPLPHDVHDRWMRPYRPGPWRVGVAALALMLAAYLLFAALIMAAAKSVEGAGVLVLLAVLVIAGTLRLLRMGVWLSGKGLRQVGYFATVTVPWQHVTSVRTAQQPVRVLGLPRSVQGQALVIVRRGGPLKPLMTDHNADFLGRVEAFDIAADAIEGWALELR
ncbi:hypothetical protein SAMN05216259_116126 [Actinacidiphila guanduensis]|uniref:PH domain-containing protein n=1 Tax=Actinacidiphila guanduensis TaxID=310781 RepID=A0A1H0PPY9_9ACTN|nr:hypothetical protein SAMN05216259_116126 [Actinacidiphila guanduensis]